MYKPSLRHMCICTEPDREATAWLYPVPFECVEGVMMWQRDGPRSLSFDLVASGKAQYSSDFGIIRNISECWFLEAIHEPRKDSVPAYDINKNDFRDAWIRSHAL